jgi:hypothetical protein
MHLLLSALSWDPQIRGILIVVTAFLILPGSVYLLLATNVGSRIGFMLALAGLSGWIAVMGVVWMVFGIGLKGREPTWKPQELITGPLANRTTVEGMNSFPNGWEKLEVGNAQLADAAAAADHTLAPSAAQSGGHGAATSGPSPEEAARFQSPFKATADYLVVGGWSRGGDNELFTLGHHKFFFRHSPHHVVIQVQPVRQVTTTAGALPPTPQVDPSKPVTTLVMVRDLGNVRLPPFLVALSALIVFAVTCTALHERDKEIMRARGVLAPA